MADTEQSGLQQRDGQQQATQHSSQRAQQSGHDGKVESAFLQNQTVQSDPGPRRDLPRRPVAVLKSILCHLVCGGHLGPPRDVDAVGCDGKCLHGNPVKLWLAVDAAVLVTVENHSRSSPRDRLSKVRWRSPRGRRVDLAVDTDGLRQRDLHVAICQPLAADCCRGSRHVRRTVCGLSVHHPLESQ